MALGYQRRTRLNPRKNPRKDRWGRKEHRSPLALAVRRSLSDRTRGARKLFKFGWKWIPGFGFIHSTWDRRYAYKPLARLHRDNSGRPVAA
jgi:hypothetical protein